jgi:hypothetical protein
MKIYQYIQVREKNISVWELVLDDFTLLCFLITYENFTKIFHVYIEDTLHLTHEIYPTETLILFWIYLAFEYFN